jgi:hypothetical protein
MKDGKLKPTKENSGKKMLRLEGKYMSSASKEALIKSVTRSISTYATSVLKFSAGLCDEMERIIRDFWWGDEFE